MTVRFTGVGAGSSTQRQQPRHEPEIGVRFTGPINWFT